MTHDNVTDIVETLRCVNRAGVLSAKPPKQVHPICEQAADEIERLRSGITCHADILKRLRALTKTRNGRGLDPSQYHLTNPDGPEAADTIATLRKQLDDAREALRQWKCRECKGTGKISVVVNGEYRLEKHHHCDGVGLDPIAREALKGKS